jgi:flagellar motor switch protein FliN/FliY
MSDKDDLELENLDAGNEPPGEPDWPEIEKPEADAADPAAMATAAVEGGGDSGGGDSLPRAGTDLEAVYDIPVQVSAVLGKSTMQVSQLLKLGRGAVVELDRKVGEAIDIYVNDRLVARGEVVVVEDRLGVTMTEIIKSGANA